MKVELWISVSQLFADNLRLRLLLKRRLRRWIRGDRQCCNISFFLFAPLKGKKKAYKFFKIRTQKLKLCSKLKEAEKSEIFLILQWSSLSSYPLLLPNPHQYILEKTNEKEKEKREKGIFNSKSLQRRWMEPLAQRFLSKILPLFLHNWKKIKLKFSKKLQTETQTMSQNNQKEQTSMMFFFSPLVSTYLVVETMNQTNKTI